MAEEKGLRRKIVYFKMDWLRQRDPNESTHIERLAKAMDAYDPGNKRAHKLAGKYHKE